MGAFALGMVTKTYEVRTYGCQINVHDSERIAGLLDEAGYAPVTDGAQPDVVVFSTCAVPENADNKLDGNLGHLKPVKDRTPGMQIAVGLRRMFSSLAGMPLSEYVRRRRMTVAAAEVVTGIGDLLGIAVRYGYGSAEAFGRAFQSVHGVSPGPTHGKAHLLDDHLAGRLRRGGGGRPRHRGRGPGGAYLHQRSLPPRRHYLYGRRMYETIPSGTSSPRELATKDPWHPVGLIPAAGTPAYAAGRGILHRYARRGSALPMHVTPGSDNFRAEGHRVLPPRQRLRGERPSPSRVGSNCSGAGGARQRQETSALSMQSHVTVEGRRVVQMDT
jgi:AraC-like DNA-binding protein